MATGKLRDFARLSSAVAGASPSPAPVTMTEVASAPAALQAQRGRRAVDTLPMQLRLPRNAMTWLVERAAKESVAAGRNVTPQQVLLGILEAARRG